VGFHVIFVELSIAIEIERHDCIFSPYSDCGIFGHYFLGNEQFAREMNYCGLCLPMVYAEHINEVEVYRASNVCKTSFF
jgi:hypothetical protein